MYHYYSQVKYSKKINHFWKKSFLHKFKNKLAQFDTKVKYRSNCNESALSKRVADSIYQMQVSRAEIGWLHDNTAYSHVSCCIHYCNLVAGMSKILVGSGDKLNYICFEHSLPPAYNSNRVNVFSKKCWIPVPTSLHIPASLLFALGPRSFIRCSFLLWHIIHCTYNICDPKVF